MRQLLSSPHSDLWFPSTFSKALEIAVMWVFLCLTSGKDLIVREIGRLQVCQLQAELDCRTTSNQQLKVYLTRKFSIIENYTKLNFLPIVDKCYKIFLWMLTLKQYAYAFYNDKRWQIYQLMMHVEGRKQHCSCIAQ